MSDTSNEDLNDATEQVSSDDSSTSGVTSTSADNRQSTVSNTVATGTSTADIQAAEDNLEASDASTTTSSDTEPTESSDPEGTNAPAPTSSDSQSNTIDSSTTDEATSSTSSDSSTNQPAEGSDDVSSGAQSVGGTDDASPTTSSATTSSAAEPAPTSEQESTTTSEGATSSDDSSTTSNSETFEVNVGQDTNTDGQIDADDIPLTDEIDNSMTFEVNVTAENDSPTAVDKSFTLQEDGVLTFTAEELLVGATDIDGDDLSIESVTYTGTDGVLTSNSDGTFSFAPNENYHGEISLNFSVSDGTETVEANIGLVVEGVNDTPVAGSTTYSVAEDGTLTFTEDQLLANSTDVEGAVSLDSVTYTGTDGVLTNNGDGTYDFAPNEHFHGEVSLGVNVVDNEGAIATTTAGISVIEVNDVPVAGGTAYSVSEDGVLTLSDEQLLANSDDVDGTLSVQDVAYSGPDGVLTNNGDGTYDFAPNEHFNGDVSFDVTIIDDDGATVSTTADVETIAVNDIPVISGDLAYSVDEDGTITFSQEQLLANASDVEGHELTASNLTVGENATVTDNGDGSFSVTPNADFNGELSINFDVSDDIGGVVEAGLNLTVDAVNDVAVVQDQAFTLNEDGSITITDAQLLSGASDVDGDNLSVVDVSYTGTDGVFTDNGDGTYDFAPNENFNGDISGGDLSFSVSDGTATTDANIDLTVTDVNDAPVAGSTTYSVAEDGTLTISDAQLLANSSDVDGTVSVDGVAYSGTDGILTDNGDGTHSFAPNENFNGDVSLDVTVIDDDGATDVTTAGIDVIAMNDTPVVSGDLAYSVDEDGSITFSQEQLLANASDVDGDNLSATNLSAGSDSTVTANGDGTFTVTPDADFNGDIELSFDVSDSDGATAQAGVGLTVNPVNDLAVVQDQAFTLNEDGSITITDAQLLSGASDVDGDTLSVADVSYSGTDGVFTDNGDGTYDFAPNENFNGDVALDFTVGDGTATTDANIDLTVTDVNDAPVAGSTTYSVAEDGTLTISDAQLLANSSDVDGTVSVDSVAYSGTDGILTDNGDGTHSFAPNENFNGDVSLDVTVVDDDGATDVTTAGIDVIAMNDTPVVSGDLAYSVDEDGSITFSQEQLLANASDVDGDSLSATNLSAGADSTVTDNGDGTFTVTPDADFNGDIELSFDVSDSDGATAQAGVGLTVNPVNDVAVVQDQAFTLNEDGSITITDAQLLSGASDVDGDTLNITDVSYSGTDGVFTDNGDGTYDFAPNENFNGDVALDFTVGDGTATTDANIDLTVTDVNDAPVAGSTTYSVAEDGTLTISDAQLLANSSDVDGTVSVDGVAYSGTDGILTDNGDGTHSFAPNENFNGDVSLDVTVVDDDGATDVTTAGIDVIAMNDTPVVSGDLAYSVDEDGSITFSQEQLLANASDIDGDSLSATNLSAGSDSTVTDNGDGTFTVTPDADFNGDIELSFDVSDSDGATAQSGVGLTVNPVNDVAVVQDQAFTLNEDGSITITDAQLLSGASDVDGDTLSVADVSYSGTDGVFTDNGDGTYDFAPNENFNGDVALDFTVGDGTATTDANIDLTVTDVNDAPVAGSTTYSVAEDGTLTISDAQLLANSSDVDGTVSVDGVAYSGTDGILTDNGDGTHSFAPNENFNGDVSLDVTVVDDDGTTASTTADVTVIDVNDAPIAGSTSYTMDEDGTLIFSDAQLLANSSDVDGDLAIDSVGYSGTNGILTDNGDGTHTFAPNENFNGEVSLDVVVIDDDGSTVSTSAEVTIDAVNDAPVAGGVCGTMSEDGVITFTEEQLLATSSDVDGDNLSISDVSYTGPDGILVDNGDSSWSFAPNENYNGEAMFSLTVTDGELQNSVHDACITIEAVNDAPVSSTLSYTVNEDGSIAFSQEQLLANATDVDGDSLTADNLTAGDNATITDNGDGTFTVTPDANFNGDIDLSFDVSDGMETISSNIELTVNPVNDVAVVQDQAFTLNEDGSITITDEQLLSGASDIDAGDTLSVADVSYTGTDGVFTDNGDGTYDFAPNENFNGDVGLNFSVSDGTATTDANIDLTVTDVNDAPIAGSTSYSVAEDGTLTFSDEQLLANSSDVDGTVSVDAVAYSGTDGVLTDNGDGTHSFAPNENFNGDVSLDVSVIDDDGATASTTAGVTVADVNDAPVAGSTTYSVSEDGTLTISDAQLLANSSDVDGTVSVDGVAYSGTDGILTDNGDGTHSFAPNENFNGNVTLDVTVVDDDGATAVTTAGVGVIAMNDVPVVSGDLSYSVNEDGSITFSQEQLLANASDLDGDGLSATNLSVGGDSTVTDNGDGTFTVTPDADFNGDIQLSFDVSDGIETVAAGVGLTVNPVNDVAVVQDQAFTLNEDGSITVTDAQLLSGASDVDGDTLNVTDVSYSGTDGVFTDNGDGTYDFAPNENFNGDVALDFTVGDGTATTDANIDLTVTDVNDAPVAGSTTYSVSEDGTLTITDAQLLANSSDVDGTVSVDGVAYSGTDGILTDNGNGTHSFAPNENFNGNVTLDVTVVDDDGATAVTTAGVDVIAMNDVPVVSGDLSYSVNEDGSITFSQEQLLANASDLDGDGLSATNLSAGGDSTVTDNGDGTFTVTPDADFNGDIQLSFDVSDSDGATAQGGVDLTVNPVNDVAVVDTTDLAGTEDNTITITQTDLLTNASDVDGDTLTASNLNIDSSFGEVVDNGDGTFSFTPAGDYNGDVPFSFAVSDGTASTTAHGNIDIAAVNDVPVLSEANFTTNEDNSIVITQAELLANATDLDGDALSITNISATDGNGSVTQNADGDWVYTPTENYSGEANLTISLNDGTVTADFNSAVTITPDADAPSLTVSLGEMSVTEFNDQSIAGGVLTGWQTDNQSGTIEVNQDSVYGVGDDRGLVMELEAAVGDVANVYQNLDIEVGDTIELSFDISARVGSQGPDSQVDIYFEGNLIDSLQPGVGWETHTYTLTATTDSPRLELDSPSHNGFGAVLDTIRISEPSGTNEDSAILLDISAAVVDTDGSESMQAIDINEIPEGAVLTDGVNTFTATADDNSVNVKDWDLSSVTITTAENFTGEVTLSVTATSVEDINGDTSSSTQELSFTVEDVNDAVVIDAGSPIEFNATEDTVFTITEAALLSNASDIDSENLIVTNLTIPNATFTTVIDAETGDKSFVVTPNENFNGDVDISFNVSDQEGSVVESGAGLSVAAVNDVAVVQDQAFTLNEDGSITITDEQLLSGASDVDGDNLSVADVSYSGTDGVFTDNGDGTYDFAPNENFNGDVGLNFSVSDGTATTDANIDLTVTDVNDAPIAGSTSYSVAEDGTLTFSDEQLLANSSDVDGTVSVDAVAYSGTDGVLTDNGDGTHSFAPNENFNGDVSIDVTVIDDDGATASTTAGVTVADVNDAPVAGSTTYSVSEDGTLTISDAQLLANSTDVDGTVSVDGVAYSGTDGILTDNGDGTHSFAPNENFNGNVSLDVTVVDDDGATDVTTAGIDVIAMNDVPVVSGDLSYSVNEDGSITFSQEQLLINASDIDGDSLSATNLSAGGDSTVTDNGDGTFTVTPDADFNGDIQLSFDVSDSDGATAQAGVGLTVNPVNDVAVVQDQAFTLNEDGSITITDAQLLSGASDVDAGDTLSVADVSYSGTDGVFTDNGDGTYDFAPNENFNGDISGGDLSFSVSDGTATTDANIDLTVTDVNDAPIAGSTSYSVAEDGTLTFSDAQLLANSSDVDGTVSVDSVAYSGTDGVLTDNGDGSHSFAPNENFNGDVSIDVTVTDDDGATVTTTAGVTVTDVNDAPVAGSTTYSVAEDGTLTISDAQLLANSTDVDGTVSVDGVAYSGTDGILTDNGDGTHSFAPNENFNGNVSLDVTVVDDDGATDVTTAGIDVIAVNDTPVVSGDLAYSVDEDGSITFSQEQLLANASDVDGDALSASLTSAENATLTDNGDGSYTITPDENYHGELNFSMDISDGTEVVQSGLDITVNSINDGPVAVDDGTVGGTLVLDGSDSLLVQVASNPSNGEFTASMWFKVDPGDSGAQGLFTAGTQTDGAADRSLFLDDDGNLNAYTWNGPAGTQTIETNVGDLADGEWHHVTYSLDGDQAQVFIDGEIAATGSMGETAFNWSDAIIIGDAHQAPSLNGEIRDVQVYTGVGADEADAQAMMAGGTIEGETPTFRHEFNGDNPFSPEGENGQITTTITGNPSVEGDHLLDGVIAADDVVTNFDVLSNDSDVEGDISITGLSEVVDAEGNVLGSLSIVDVDGAQQVQFKRC